MDILDHVIFAVLIMCFEGLMVCFMMLCRTKVCFDHSGIAIGITSKNSKNAIERGDKDWGRFWRLYEIDDKHADNLYIGDLLKWKYEDFYPNVKKVRSCS